MGGQLRRRGEDMEKREWKKRYTERSKERKQSEDGNRKSELRINRETEKR